MPIGSYPAVLGHEGVGIVRRVGPLVANKSLSPGDTVLLSLRTCNACRPCRSGSKGACEKATEMNFVTGRPGSNTRPPISLPDGTPVHGQFFGQSSLSQMAIVSQHSVIKLEGAQPRDLPFLPPLACGYLTGAGTVFNVLQPTGEDTVAVLGAGAVGFAAIMAARARGARAIVAVDILDEKLEIALSLGATHVVNTRETTDLAAGLRAIFPQGVDRIVDTTGLPALLNKAFEALAHHGILALVGVPPPTADVQFNALELLTGCKRVIGVIEGWADPQKVIVFTLLLVSTG